MVYQDEHTVAFRDLNPQAPTHVLVVPRRHIAGLADEPDGPRCSSNCLPPCALSPQQEDLVACGFRTVINTGRDAQQSVAHLHIHVLGGRPLTVGHPDKRGSNAPARMAPPVHPPERLVNALLTHAVWHHAQDVAAAAHGVQ